MRTLFLSRRRRHLQTHQDKEAILDMIEYLSVLRKRTRGLNQQVGEETVGVSRLSKLEGQNNQTPSFYVSRALSVFLARGFSYQCRENFPLVNISHFYR